MRKLTKEARAHRALALENPPGAKEVVVTLCGPLHDTGKQQMCAWWRRYADRPDDVQGEATLVEPEAFRARWEARGFTLKILPSEFTFNQKAST